MRIVSVPEMRELERLTFDSGIPEAELQRRAGAAVAQAIAELLPSPGFALALVGSGNNGRDAWIAAEGLQRRGWGVSLYLTPSHTITDEEIDALEAAGGRVFRCVEADIAGALAAVFEGVTVAIDGLLGIGAGGAPRPPLAEIIETLNARRAADPMLTVVAVDSPSGVNADTGEAPGPAVRADATVVLGGAKRGLLSTVAAPYIGRLVFADIGIVDGPVVAPQVLTAPSVRGLLAPRPPDAHKGTFGRLLVVSGSDQFVGAAYLVCAAAARAGAGVVTLAAPRWLRDVVAGRLAEVTYLPLPDGGPGAEPAASAERVAAELDRFQALAIGPGLSTEGGVPEFVEAILRTRAERGTPAVLDADALNILARIPGWADWIGDGVALTPHAGELGRLATDIEPGEAPWEVAQRLARNWRVTLVLKGPFTAIGSPRGAWVQAAPNPALATAGTGDVLAGIIGGLLARGMEVDAAARLGVWAHSRAAERAARGYEAGGMLASDLLAEVPPALAQSVGG